jgi:hypothetical protein
MEDKEGNELTGCGEDLHTLGDLQLAAFGIGECLKMAKN